MTISMSVWVFKLKVMKKNKQFFFLEPKLASLLEILRIK